ncbi:MAG TPA: hypothetical protein VHN55_08515 [Sphingomicrobium sp.]|nr:hypothetical protein [Sphingomicrobium sp.]
MNRKIVLLAASLSLALPGCTGMGEGGFSNYYSLVRAREVKVGDGSMTVTPTREWNRQRHVLFDDVKWVEDWTLNGPLLDDLTFVSGLPHGKYLVETNSRDAQQVPRFHSDMTAPEIQALLESAYRVRGGAVDFRTLSLKPRQFLGHPGFELDYEHLDSDELWRKGRAVGAVIGGRLYLIMLDAARSHYFPDELDDFEAIVASARLRR